MGQAEDIHNAAFKNYSESGAWPDKDAWHTQTKASEKDIVERWLARCSSENSIILNAGSGGTTYSAKGEYIHLDIVESYVSAFSNHIIGSVEKIDLTDNSVDGVICVGSVINYVDAQRAISELARVLKHGGFFILEFERSNSAEFLFTDKHGRQIVFKKYFYNNQEHPMWLYSEQHIRHILQLNRMTVKDTRRIHTLSSLAYRFGVLEEKAAALSRYDRYLQLFSYPLAHNGLFFGVKDFSSK